MVEVDPGVYGMGANVGSAVCEYSTVINPGGSADLEELGGIVEIPLSG